MDDIIQFEGAGELPNLDSIGGRVAAAQLRSRRYRLGEAVIAAMSNCGTNYAEGLSGYEMIQPKGGEENHVTKSERSGTVRG